ncbi:hypothetical protein [Salipiger sp. PrR003]|uniref:hypothetical protein n=1 Tax=Salipiger sp. PrR003 TaxID=2706776 RepID=UPI0013DBB2AC|nr:hypothetical protein [Salipiger sp. PrR003]NDV52796.1 hypothetical protein [Salipiger sp. PrR003]
MKTDEITKAPQPQEDTNWWMNAILGKPSGIAEVDNMREAAAIRVDEAHAGLANHLRAATRDDTNSDSYRTLAATLIVSSALHVHRENHPKGHSALMSACLSSHPDLEEARGRLFRTIDTQKAHLRELRIQRAWLAAVFFGAGLLAGHLLF